MKQKRIIISVTNDLATDQRVKRHCSTLYDEGYDILLTGRMLGESLPVDDMPWKTRRVRHWFNKGALFYAEYNIRLFAYLLFAPCDIMHANDLDTLPANFLSSRIRGIPLVYDSHEYFTEVPELTGRPVVKKIWETIEKVIFPRLSNIITVNRSIALAYKKKYGKDIRIIRNLPERWSVNSTVSPTFYGLPENKKLIILQGAGINRDRGAEEAVEAMRYIDNAILVVAGKGDIIPELKTKVSETSFQEKVFFIPPLPYKELMQLTGICDLGLSLDKDTNLNYRYSLPNKLFDYIMAGIPVLVSDLPELKQIVEKYEIGLIAEDYSPKGIAGYINSILSGKSGSNLKNNLQKAADVMNWDKEKHKLISLYRELQ